MRVYTNKKCRVKTHNYKKKGVTHNLILVGVRAMWGTSFETELVLGTNDD